MITELSAKTLLLKNNRRFLEMLKKAKSYQQSPSCTRVELQNYKQAVLFCNNFKNTNNLGKQVFIFKNDYNEIMRTVNLNSVRRLQCKKNTQERVLSM